MSEYAIKHKIIFQTHPEASSHSLIFAFIGVCKGAPPMYKKNVFFWALPKLPLPPPSTQFGQLVPLILDVKNDVLAHITEPSNDYYDNGVSIW